jgi:hypothetical protein
MVTKGKISPLLDAILSDPVESQKLRRAIATGEDYVIEVSGTTYRIVTSTQNSAEARDIPLGDRLAKEKFHPA